MKRRDFFKLSLAASTAVIASPSEQVRVKKPIDTREVSKIAFAQKRPLITYSDRPPLLETPREAFTTAITPNNELFVRWHMSNIPTHFDLDTYYIQVHGEVKNRLYLTVDALKKDFQALGMQEAFEASADFRGMTGKKDLMIDDILHKAFIKVDEQGSEAAATTAIMMVGTGAPGGDPASLKEMIVNRPFIFFIKDLKSGQILFMGIVQKP